MDGYGQFRGGGGHGEQSEGISVWQTKMKSRLVTLRKAELLRQRKKKNEKLRLQSTRIHLSFYSLKKKCFESQKKIPGGVSLTGTYWQSEAY